MLEMCRGGLFPKLQEIIEAIPSTLNDGIACPACVSVSVGFMDTQFWRHENSENV